MGSNITGDLLIGGQAVSKSERVSYAVDPETGEALGPEFVPAAAPDVDRAAELAWSAFDSFRLTDVEMRAQLLDFIAAKFEGLGDILLERGMRETGLSRGRLESERARTVYQLRLFAKVVRDRQYLDLVLDPAQPHRLPAPKPELRMRQIPIGPVAIFGASNFPFAFSVAGGDTASALAAGCPVIVKGHPAHPGTSELVGREIQAAVRELGLPEGVFSLLTGAIEPGTALVMHPRIKAVGFTGSRSGGLALMALAAARPEPIPVYAEMSSINPVFLLPDALAARAPDIAAGYVASLTLGSGQFCTNPGVVLAIDGPSLNQFIGFAKAAVENVAPAPMLTAGIHAAFEKGLSVFLAHAGVKLEARGASGQGANRTRAAILSTDASIFLSDQTLAHEVFGASSLIIRCADEAQLAEVAEQLEGQLTATLHLERSDYTIARHLIPVLERKVGRLIANGWPTSVEVSPAMVHGGPFPSTSDSRGTSVGTTAIRRFLRPVCYQDFPLDLLPVDLRETTATAQAAPRLPY
ncbi:aldehyde dehydrogenase (NADP(+)) [Mesorhizobium sp. B2-1-8]|uniref:aldehyde dehydrogenase (NADP(+)) n=1 Tax=Mesorhizobium sp. B2-1-8 TaxID=2589967 RepID=UPI001125F086|nr:aldehyde dehydrogenase (NADP(+)) [Mesorhizobium sp. B2-1-8]UCI17902.1 aldehyde dehydrogenase (NADP(+)) [Mesorhizobium sp. B2-1-8]